MRSRIKLLIIRILSRSSLLTKLYYFFSGKFDLEFSTTMSGRRRHLEQSSRFLSVSKIRRDVHRIEKGLVMRPRKEVFALDYIEDLVRSLDSAQCDEVTTSWAVSVIGVYFKVTKSSDERWRRALINFDSIVIRFGVDLDKSSPIKKAELSESDISEMKNGFASLIKYRRSVRHFKKISIDKKIIGCAVSAAICSPSACNRVPYKFYICNDSPKAQKIARCAGGTNGYVDDIHNIAVVVGDLSNYENEVDRHAPFIDASLAIMSFVYALESYGLSSVCINWHDQKIRRARLSSHIPLMPWEVVIMLVAFGEAQDDLLVPASGKKQLGSVVKYV